MKLSVILTMICLILVAEDGDFGPRLASATSTSSKKRQSIKNKRENLKRFVREDEGDLVEPYVGGYNSQKSAILVVEFHDFDEVRTKINTRWRAFREMVEDM